MSSRNGEHFPFWTKNGAHKNKACDIYSLTYFLAECFGIDSMQGLVGDLSLEVVHFALQPVDLILEQLLLVLDLLHVVF